MKLSRLSSKFDKGFFNMYQFGYNEGDDRLGVKVDRIKDYFFYSAEHIDDILDIRQFDCKRTYMIHYMETKCTRCTIRLLKLKMS